MKKDRYVSQSNVCRGEMKDVICGIIDALGFEISTR